MSEQYIRILTDIGYTWTSQNTFNPGESRLDFIHEDSGYPPLSLESTDDGLTWSIFRKGEKIFHGPIVGREELLKLLDILTI